LPWIRCTACDAINIQQVKIFGVCDWWRFGIAANQSSAKTADRQTDRGGDEQGRLQTGGEIRVDNNLMREFDRVNVLHAVAAMQSLLQLDPQFAAIV